METDFFGKLMGASPDIVNIPIDQLVFRLMLAFVLGCVIAAIYRVTQRAGTPSSTGFVSTLVLLCILIAIVTQVVGDNPARAFSLVGILSIVRFRTVVEDTRDTAFVIFAVMIGMGTGVGNHQVAILGLAVVGSAAAILRFVPTLGAKPEPAWTLHLRVGTGAGGATPWEGLLQKWCQSVHLQSTATARQGASLDLTYKVQLKPDVAPLQLLSEINRIEGIQNLEMKRES